MQGCPGLWIKRIGVLSWKSSLILAMPQVMERDLIPPRLLPQQLRSQIDAEGLGFASSAELEPFVGVLGQERALTAIEFGVAMNRPGYNLYVMGESGTGRLSIAQHYLQAHARQLPAPDDWVYLNNFADPRSPKVLALSAGMGEGWVTAMEGFVDNLLATLPAVFENPSYQRRKAAIERSFNQCYEKAIEKVQHRAQEKNIALFRESETISFSPMLGEAPATEDEFAAFSEEDKEAFHKQAKALEKYLGEALLELPQWKRETRDRLRELNRETISEGIDPLLTPIQQLYSDRPNVLGYLQEVRGNLLRTAGEWLPEDASVDAHGELMRRQVLINQYAPKLLVSHLPGQGAPVVYESNPTYQNLFGRIEYINDQGMLVTHHRLICAGALHRANGGYLLLDAEKLLTEPLVWSALKRALKDRQIRIEVIGQEQPPVAAVSLSPEVIPLSIKLVLIGTRELYYLLQSLDGEFNELFRVLADFDGHLERNEESMWGLIRLLRNHADSAGLMHFTASAAACLLEQSMRQVEHQRRFSARLCELFELLGEADLVRAHRHDPVIDLAHVEQALLNKDQRLGRVSQQLLDEMLEGVVLIDTDGQAVGKVNGLTVLEVGDSRFGSPARITATVYAGERGVVDIEREVELGQAIHSKGVMILAGYLGHRYARGFQLAISANIALEQSYGYIEGDSAALAELCALISALTGVSLHQSMAVTGSINQYGEVQAVGGVNEKIEGFFRLCQARGLTGKQGVIIPQGNLHNLMLKHEVTAAVEEGGFSVYVVSTVDQALTLLTGKSARTVDRLALGRLRRMAAQQIGRMP